MGELGSLGCIFILTLKLLCLSLALKLSIIIEKQKIEIFLKKMHKKDIAYIFVFIPMSK